MLTSVAPRAVEYVPTGQNWQGVMPPGHWVGSWHTHTPLIGVYPYWHTTGHELGVSPPGPTIRPMSPLVHVETSAQPVVHVMMSSPIPLS